jgi:hypothetical protein
MEYIDLQSTENPKEINLVIRTDAVPKRIVTEYELSAKVKNISKEDQEVPGQDMPR